MYRSAIAFLSFLMVVVVNANRVHAEELYWDNFSDRTITGEWAASAAFPNSLVSADTGDLRVSQSPLELAGVAIGVADALSGLVDTSIRTQVVLNGGDHVELHARRNDATNEAYSVAIFDNANVFVLRFNTLADFSVLGSGTALDASGTPLDVSQEDLRLQLDVIGNELNFWAWRPTEGMPATPTAFATDPDPAIGAGSVALVVVQGSADSPGSGDFRFVHVANTHIPEPSTAILCFLAFACVFVWRRMKP